MPFPPDPFRWEEPEWTSKDTRENVLLLSELAEAVGGATLVTSEQTETLNWLSAEKTKSIRKKIAERFSDSSLQLTPIQRFLKWSVSDPRHRTLSPLSLLTFSEWAELKIKDGWTDDLRQTTQVDPGNPRLLAYLGLSLLKNESNDPGETKRARGEADFLTTRALKLAPDNEEIKKVRAEAVELLTQSSSSSGDSPGL